MIAEGRRQINGMAIDKYTTRNGGVFWQSIRRTPPTENTSFNRETGETVTVITHGDAELVWSGSIDPHLTRARYDHVRFRDFNPYDPDPEHDEYEQLLKVSEWFAAKFAAQFKIRPREPIGSLSLGPIRISYNCHKAGCDDSRARELLRLHAQGDWGQNGHLGDHQELTEDQRWCPPLYGVGVVNAVSIATSSGIVQSAFPARGFNGQHRETVEFLTFLSDSPETLILSRRHDH
jgi:hypothetical protein